MSYSIEFKASNKTEAIAQVATELNAVVALSPEHAADRDKAQAAVEAYLALLPDDFSQDVAVSLSGEYRRSGPGTPLALQARLYVNIALYPR